jgi:hypothetical protein
MIKSQILLSEDSMIPSLPTAATEEITAEMAIERLRAAGALVTLDELGIFEEAKELSPQERDRIGRLMAGDQPVEVLIAEDRGEV